MLPTSKLRHGLARIRAALPAVALLALLAPSAFSGTVTLQNAAATFSQSSPSSQPVSTAIDGVFTPGNGWGIYGWSSSPPPIAVFQTVTNQGFVGGTLFTFNLYQDYDWHSIGDFRLSITQDGRANWGADGLDTSGAWTVLNPLTAVATNGPTLAIQADASILASGTDPTSTVYTVTAWTNLTAITGIRLETLTNASLPGGGPGRNGNGNFVLTEITVSDEISNGSSVPEPGTLGTLAIALGGFAAVMRKRLAR
jgi:hypothetical protein